LRLALLIFDIGKSILAIYLITGSNRGIGLEFCRQLKERGDEVIATCRSSSKELEDLDLKVASGVDITSMNSILNLKNKLNSLKVDVMIHNAGIAENNQLTNLSAASLKRQFEVNALGPLLFVQSMLENLRHGSKVGLITSRMGSIEDNTSGGSYGYRMSKAALCMAGKSLSIDLKPSGISVALLHPGLVSTRMTGFTKNGISTEQSVIGLLQRIDSLSLKTSGNFWHANGEVLPW
jgi:NAD(P)-dependent dehydrogenase (short-subunit alcohol dehydrogenase family)